MDRWTSSGNSWNYLHENQTINHDQYYEDKIRENHYRDRRYERERCYKHYSTEQNSSRDDKLYKVEVSSDRHTDYYKYCEADVSNDRQADYFKYTEPEGKKKRSVWERLDVDVRKTELMDEDWKRTDCKRHRDESHHMDDLSAQSWYETPDTFSSASIQEIENWLHEPRRTDTKYTEVNDQLPDEFHYSRLKRKETFVDDRYSGCSNPKMKKSDGYWKGWKDESFYKKAVASYVPSLERKEHFSYNYKGRPHSDKYFVIDEVGPETPKSATKDLNRTKSKQPTDKNANKCSKKSLRNSPIKHKEAASTSGSISTRPIKGVDSRHHEKPFPQSLNRIQSTGRGNTASSESTLKIVSAKELPVLNKSSRTSVQSLEKQTDVKPELAIVAKTSAEAYGMKYLKDSKNGAAKAIAEVKTVAVIPKKNGMNPAKVNPKYFQKSPVKLNNKDSKVPEDKDSIKNGVFNPSYKSLKMCKAMLKNSPISKATAGHFLEKREPALKSLINNSPIKETVQKSVNFEKSPKIEMKTMEGVNSSEVLSASSHPVTKSCIKTKKNIVEGSKNYEKCLKSPKMGLSGSGEKIPNSVTKEETGKFLENRVSESKPSISSNEIKAVQKFTNSEKNYNVPMKNKKMASSAEASSVSSISVDKDSAGLLEETAETPKTELQRQSLTPPKVTAIPNSLNITEKLSNSPLKMSEICPGNNFPVVVGPTSQTKNKPPEEVTVQPASVNPTEKTNCVCNINKSLSERMDYCKTDKSITQNSQKEKQTSPSPKLAFCIEETIPISSNEFPKAPEKPLPRDKSKSDIQVPINETSGAAVSLNHKNKKNNEQTQTDSQLNLLSLATNTPSTSNVVELEITSDKVTKNGESSTKRCTINEDSAMDKVIPQEMKEPMENLEQYIDSLLGFVKSEFPGLYTKILPEMSDPSSDVNMALKRIRSNFKVEQISGDYAIEVMHGALMESRTDKENEASCMYVAEHLGKTSKSVEKTGEEKEKPEESLTWEDGIPVEPCSDKEAEESSSIETLEVPLTSKSTPINLKLVNLTEGRVDEEEELYSKEPYNNDEHVESNKFTEDYLKNIVKIEVDLDEGIKKESGANNMLEHVISYDKLDDARLGQDIKQELTNGGCSVEDQLKKREYEAELASQQISNLTSQLKKSQKQTQHLKKTMKLKKSMWEQTLTQRNEYKKRRLLKEIRLVRDAALKQVRQEYSDMGRLAKEVKILKEELDKTREDAVLASSLLKIEKEAMENVVEAELQCIICAEPFLKAMTLRCSHTFCHKCIKLWQKTQKTCPICRTYAPTTYNSLVIDTFIDKISERLSEDFRNRRAALKNIRGKLG